MLVYSPEGFHGQGTQEGWYRPLGFGANTTDTRYFILNDCLYIHGTQVTGYPERWMLNFWMTMKWHRQLLLYCLSLLYIQITHASHSW